MSEVTFQHADSSEIKEITKINNLYSPALGELVEVETSRLIEQIKIPCKIMHGDCWIGLIFLLDHKSDYKSPNFLYFKKCYQKFWYIDRVAIFKNYQRQAYGKRVYQKILKLMKKGERLTLEVNTKPLNQESLDFHHSLGFRAIGQSKLLEKQVSYLVLEKG